MTTLPTLPGCQQRSLEAAHHLLDHDRVRDGLDWLEVDTVTVHEGSVQVTGRLVAPVEPFGFFVLGDLHVEGDLVLDSGRGGAISLIVVSGNVRAKNLLFRRGAVLLVLGAVDVSGGVFGALGSTDMGAAMWVGGSLTAATVLLDESTELTVEGPVLTTVLGGDVRCDAAPAPSRFPIDAGLFDARGFDEDTGAEFWDVDAAWRLATTKNR